MKLIDLIRRDFKRNEVSSLTLDAPPPATSLSVFIHAAIGAPAFIAALIFEVLFFSFFGEGFLTIGNLFNFLRQGSVLALPAIGMTYVILCAEIDLSPGGLMSLSGVLLAILMNNHVSLLTAIGVTLALGLFAGLVNGLLTTKGGIPSFLVTLSMMGMTKGIALVLSDAESVRLPVHPFFKAIADGHFLWIPNPVWIATVTCLFFYAVLRYTKLGFHVYEVGSNQNAARLMGTDIPFVKVFVFLVSGFLSSLAGIVLISRMNSAHPTVAVGYEFEAIAATILGGTIFEGGKGGLLGTMAGVIVITILRNGLNMMGLNTSIQLTVFGVIIILALSFDIFRYGGRQKDL